MRRIIPVTAGLLMLGLLLSLGFWQLDRANEKRALQAAYAGASAAAPLVVGTVAEIEALPRYTRVAMLGTFDSARQGLLDAQVHEGRPGYRVWTPFSLVGGGIVLVDRGWVPANPDRNQLPPVDVATAQRQVVGMVAPLPRAGLVLEAPEVTSQDWPRRLLWPDAETVAANWGEGVPDRIVLLHEDAADGFVREWMPATGIPPERHLGYAVQWFGLATALLVIGVVLLGRRNRKDNVER